MVVLVLRSVKPGLKGLVTRWLSEIGTGVYLGTLSARVRDLLWKRVEGSIGNGGGGAVLIWSDQTEQGYSVKTTGELPYGFEDFEGLVLAKRVKLA